LWREDRSRPRLQRVHCAGHPWPTCSRGEGNAAGRDVRGRQRGLQSGLRDYGSRRERCLLGRQLWPSSPVRHLHSGKHGELRFHVRDKDRRYPCVLGCQRYAPAPVRYLHFRECGLRRSVRDQNRRYPGLLGRRGDAPVRYLPVRQHVGRFRLRGEDRRNARVLGRQHIFPSNTAIRRKLRIGQHGSVLCLRAEGRRHHRLLGEKHLGRGYAPSLMMPAGSA